MSKRGLTAVCRDTIPKCSGLPAPEIAKPLYVQLLTFGGQEP